MDKNRVSGIINKVVADAKIGSVEIFFEEDDVLRLEVISNNFKGMRLLKRIDFLSTLFSEYTATELADYHLVFNPLTANEKLNGVSELTNESTRDVKKTGVAASSHY